MTCGRRGSSGFALVEVMISLTLFALILAMLPGALRAGQRALRDALSLSRPEAAALSLRHVAQRLEEALPHYDRRGGRPTMVMFHGTADGVRFLAPMWNGPLGGGVYRLDLERHAGSSGTETLAVRMTLQGDESVAAGDAGEERVLLRGVNGVRFRYFGSKGFDDARDWKSDWVDAERLPALVEIAWRTRDGKTAPPLRIVLRLR